MAKRSAPQFPQPFPETHMTSAIIVAAGSSRRMGFDKMFAELAGKPVIWHSLHAFEQTREIDEIVVVVKDEKAPPLWARMYEVGTDRPIFASRDGIKVYSLAEVDRERRTGSGWYGSWPRELLEQEYPRWKKQAGS